MIFCRKFYAEKKTIKHFLENCKSLQALEEDSSFNYIQNDNCRHSTVLSLSLYPLSKFISETLYLSICLFVCLFVCLSKDGRVCEKANQHEAESMIFFSETPTTEIMETPTTELMETPSTEILGNIRSFWKYQCSTNFISKKGIELSTFRSFKSHSNKHRLLAFKKSVLYPLRLFV